MPDLAATCAAEALDVAAQLFAAPSSSARAKLLAAWLVDLVPDSACIVYRFESELPEFPWKATGRAGDVSLASASLASETPLLLPMLDAQNAIVYSASALQREDYAHLQVTRSFASIAYLPLTLGELFFGAIEVLSFSTVLSAEDLEALEPLLRIATPALAGVKEVEQEKEDLLDSVHRMTQLYDLEKSLNSTLDLDLVMVLIPRKVQPMLQCQAVHLWLFDGDTLRVMATAGSDATISVGTMQEPGEGYVADMAEEGEPITIADPEDERLLLRNQMLGSQNAESRIWTSMMVR